MNLAERWAESTAKTHYTLLVSPLSFDTLIDKWIEDDDDPSEELYSSLYRAGVPCGLLLILPSNELEGDNSIFLNEKARTLLVIANPDRGEPMLSRSLSSAP